MDLLNKTIAKNTFAITEARENIFYLSFIWHGLLTSVMWSSINEQVLLTLPDYVGIDYEDMAIFIKETLSEINT